jgi:hypothetical protein
VNVQRIAGRVALRASALQRVPAPLKAYP